jgi:hypothetical protein
MDKLVDDDVLVDVLGADADGNGAAGVAWVFLKKSGGGRTREVRGDKVCGGDA